MSAAQLSIRSYTLIMHAHAHSYHQLVLPVHGVIDIMVSGQQGNIGPGHAVVIPAETTHSFRANEQSRFLVADVDTLPANVQALQTPFISISAPLRTFCEFADQQLQHQLNPTLEHSIGELFLLLLAEQAFKPRVDARIARVQEYLKADLSVTPPLDELAALACLSLSQYKTLFKQQSGQSTGQYLLGLRMEKARALLAHTDYPIGRVAEQVGYQDASAFSRRFSAHFGQAPRDFCSHHVRPDT